MKLTKDFTFVVVGKVVLEQSTLSCLDFRRRVKPTSNDQPICHLLPDKHDIINEAKERF